MRNLFRLLVIITIPSVLSCESEQEELYDKHLKVLFFGNSFTEDAVSYVPFIVSNLSPDLDLTVGVASIGACSLAQHASNLSGHIITLNDLEFKPKNYSFYCYNSMASKWSDCGSLSAEEIIRNEHWDIIAFQQSGSTAAKQWDVYYEPFLESIQNSLSSLIDYSFKLGWVLIHGAYSSQGDGNYLQWLGAMENSKKVLENSDTEILFPYGTAVQNLRTTSLRELGDAKDLLADNGHLQEGIGCLTAAYSISIVLLRQFGLSVNTIIGEPTRPSIAWDRSVGVICPNFGETYSVIGISDNNCYLAQLAAIFSYDSPFTITDCQSFDTNSYSYDSFSF